MFPDLACGLGSAAEQIQENYQDLSIGGIFRGKNIMMYPLFGEQPSEHVVG
jgi:hypothetical protein